jgi:hypothetical protein
MTIHVIIHHDSENGTIEMYHGATEDEAKLQLYPYIVDRWHDGDEWCDGYPVAVAGPIPADKMEAIDQYFGDWNDVETLIFKTIEVQPTK